MSTPTVLPFPRFAAGAPLRANDLTKLFSYFEGNDHHTRACLLGMGIFYGLKISLSTSDDGTVSTVQISAGAGVTSQGYLYCQDEDLEFSHFTTARVSDADFTNVLTTSDLAASTGTTLSRQFDVLELKETDTGATLNPNILKDKILVILFEIESTRLNGCSTCNNGFSSNIFIRRLLVPSGSMPNAANNCDVPLGPSKRQSGFPYLTRFGYNRTRCCNDFSFKTLEEFAQNYRDAIIPGVHNLQEILARDLPVYARLLGFDEKTEEVKNPLSFWKADFQKEPRLQQYLHDYLRHIIRAYTELVESPFGRAFKGGLPAEKCFPKFLKLGHFSNTEDAALSLTSDNTRHRLYLPPWEDPNDEDFRLARASFKRLLAMLAKANLLFDDGELIQAEGRQIIKITPSRKADKRLGTRAIPFYFRGSKIRPYWDLIRSDTDRTDSISSYDRPQDSPPFGEPLLYQNAFDEADFYRIEGHIGKHITEVIAELGYPDNIPQQADEKRASRRAEKVPLRTCQNLPFRIVVVTLGLRKLKNKVPTLSDFARQNPGLEHQGGVPSGGTFVIVVDVVKGTASESGEATGKMQRIEEFTPRSEQMPEPGSTYEVVADFCLPYFYYETQPPDPIAIFEEKQRTPAYSETVEGNTRIRHLTGYQITFNNSSENADEFLWEVFAQGQEASGGNVQASVKYPNQEHLTHIFPVSSGGEFTYIVRLTARSADTSTFDITEQEVIVRSVEDIVEDIPNEEPILRKNKPAPESTTPSVRKSSPVSPLVAMRQLEERRIQYRKEIDEEGAAHKTFAKTSVFRNIQTFLKEFDDKVKRFDKGALNKAFEGLGDFGKDFETCASPLLDEVAKGRNLSDANYTGIFQNLLYFYLDNLVHLLTEDMLKSKKTLANLESVLSKTRSKSPAIDLQAWRDTWHAEQIMTEQNELTIFRLKELFDQ